MSTETDLAKEACEACRAGAPKVSALDIPKLMHQIPEWEVVNHEGTLMLEREYEFPDFSGALAFTNRVGELAESLQHHPDILTAWGRVKLVWYTHKIGGLHRNDFRCAARSDQLYG